MTVGNPENFGVSTLNEYAELIGVAFSEFRAEPNNFLRAYTCCLLINHMPDWVASKADKETLEALGYPSDEQSLKERMKRDFPELETIRKISNGLKHLNIKVPTESVSGFGQGPFGVGPFGKPYLLVSQNSEPISALELVSKGQEAWNVLLEKLNSQEKI